MAGTIALLRPAVSYEAYDYIVRVVRDRPGAEPPQDQSWTVAVQTATGAQALEVGASAFRHSRFEVAMSALDRARESSSDDVAAIAGNNLGVTLSELGRSAEAVAIYDQVVDRYGADPAPALREQVAGALFNKGVALGALGRSAEAVAVYDQVLDRYGADPAPALREQVARALVNKGVALGELGRSAEAVAVYDQVVDRYGADPAPALRELVAQALVNKAYRLGQLGRSAEAVAVYDQVVDRYGADPAPALGEAVARADSARQKTQEPVRPAPDQPRSR